MRTQAIVGLLILGGLAIINRGTLRDALYAMRQPALPPAQTREALATHQPERAAALNLAVPFTSQAPHANWDYPYQEACEEASAIMLDAFYKGRALPPDTADKEILDLVAWENRTFGYYKDTTAEEVARILKEYFGMQHIEVVKNFTIDDIKNHLRASHPVIIPAAGQMLGNPFFRQPGPLYHMLVIKGFTDQGLLITNDPGTRRGKDFLYTPEALLQAIHDWNNGNVKNGDAVMIVAYP